MTLLLCVYHPLAVEFDLQPLQINEKINKRQQLIHDETVNRGKSRGYGIINHNYCKKLHELWCSVSSPAAVIDLSGVR